jgi:hypothetical protein
VSSDFRLLQHYPLESRNRGVTDTQAPGLIAQGCEPHGCEQLILGSAQMGNVHLSPEAEAYFAKKGCTVLLQPTPKAIHTINNSHAKKIGLFHVTC